MSNDAILNKPMCVFKEGLIVAVTGGSDVKQKGESATGVVR